MIAPTLPPQIAKGIKDGDLSLTFPGGFNGTEGEVAAVTESGREILGEVCGFGAVSARWRKSAFIEMPPAPVAFHETALVGFAQ